MIYSILELPNGLYQIISSEDDGIFKTCVNIAPFKLKLAAMAYAALLNDPVLDH